MNKIFILMFIFISTIVHADNTQGMYERFKNELKSSDIVKNPIFEQAEQDMNIKQTSDKGIYYFVSFSMPDIAIKEIANSAYQYNIPIFINGLIDNDMKKTVAKFTTFFKEDSKGGIGIDPNKFDEFNIKSVPTLIVKCEKGIDKLTGNIPIKQAIEKVLESGDCKNSLNAMLRGNNGKY